MTKASDNEFPSLLVKEGTAPASPGSGDQRVFIDSSDHLLKVKNSSGTVTAVGGSASGSITASGYTQTTARLLGRTTASTGAIEEITVGTGLSLSAGSLSATGGGSSGSFTTLSGWTTLGTLDTSNVTDVANYWHAKRACSSDINGIYKAVPGSTPYTITVHIPSIWLTGSNHPSIGIMLLDSTPTAIREFSLNLVSGATLYTSLRRYTNRTTFSTAVDTALTTQIFIEQLWLQLLYTSSSSVTFRWSLDGMLYHDISGLTAISPTLTAAYYGLCLSDPVTASTPEGVFDLPVVT